MKKITLSLAVVFLTAVLLCSCGIPAQKQECFCIPENFICDIFVTNNDVEYRGSLERQDGKYILKIDQPESISGLTVTYEQGVYSAQFDCSEMSVTPSNDFFLKEAAEFIEGSYGKNSFECIEKDGKYIIKHNCWELRFDP